MKQYKEFIVSYDIVANKPRKKLMESLKDLGLLSIQKSVMWGRLNRAEEKAALILIKKYCIGAEDKAVILEVDFASVIKEKSIGYGNGEFFQERLYEVI
jgi:CRISPR-associated endonuclease Cas2